MLSKKTLTEEQALNKLASLCATAEHSTGEATEKMRKWGLNEQAQARVIQRLIDDRYIDDTRFARIYIKEKLRFNGWGRRKIEMGLYAKGVERSLYQPLFNEIPREEWVETLRPLLQAKRRSTKAESDYELRGKLLRYALSRGFSMEEAEEAL